MDPVVARRVANDRRAGRAAGEIQLRYPTVAGSVPIKTWKDRRDEGIVKHTLDAS